MRQRLLWGFTLILIASLTMACSKAAPPTPTPTLAGTPLSLTPAVPPSPTPTPAPAPSPAHVDVSKLTLIDEWRENAVPRYPGAQRGSFETFSTQIKNGGIMLFHTTDSPEQVIAFYRGALTLLGWQEQRADGHQVVARRGPAALTAVATGSTGNTTIMLILTDAT